MGLDNANVNANDMEKFGGDRSEWEDWSFEFILHMEAHGLGYILDDGDNVSEPNSLKKEKPDYKNQSRVVWSILLTSLTKPVRKWLVGELPKDEKNGRQAWRILKDHYERRDPRMITKLNLKLLDSRFTAGMEPIEFATDFQETVNRLKTYGHSMDEFLLADIFMRAVDGRDQAWSQWLQMIQELRREKEDEFTYREIHSRFLSRVSWKDCDEKVDVYRVNVQANKSTSSTGAATQHTAKNQVRCQLCNKLGHSARQCPSNRKKASCNVHAKIAALGDEIRDLKIRQKDSCSCSLMAVDSSSMINQNQEDKWIWDTGATHHMSNNLKEFVDVVSVGNKTVSTAGSTVKVTKKGTVKKTIRLPTGETRIIQLKNVYYLPHLKNSLLSASQMEHMGFTWDKHKLKRGKLMIPIHRRDNQYFVDFNSKINFPAKSQNSQIHQPQRMSKQSLKLLHRRFGHANVEMLRKLPRHVVGLNLLKNDLENKCSVCSIEKLVKQNIPKQPAKRSTTRILEKIHMDIGGRMGIKS